MAEHMRKDFSGSTLTCGPTNAILIRGFAVLHGLGEADVAREAGRAGEQHQELVIFGDVDGLFGGNVVRRSVEQACALEHSGRIRKPDRVPVGFDFTGGRPARAGATVEILKRGRVQQKCFQRHMGELLILAFYGLDAALVTVHCQVRGRGANGKHLFPRSNGHTPH